MKDLMPTERIEQAIFLIRGQKVMLDADLAELYGVTTKAFNRAVKRNIERFPEDFMFPLTIQEVTNLRCQIGTSRSWGGRRFCLSPLPSRALPCSQAFCGASVRCR